jgi:hypothetical protein
MTPTLSRDLQEAQRIAATAQVLAVVTLVIFGINIAAKLGIPVSKAIFSSDNPWREDVHAIGLILVSTLPAILFFEAVNQLRHALAQYRDGEFFTSAIAERVTRAGDYAIAAMIAVMFVVPNLTLWISRQGGFDIRLENEFIGMLAFALFVSAVGRVLAAATELKADNDAIV